MQAWRRNDGRVAQPTLPPREAALLLGLLALTGIAGLALGLTDVVVPVATGNAPFAGLHRPAGLLAGALLGLRAFAHNWGVALVVPAIGGLSVHYEPRTRLVAGILLLAVLVGSVGGLALFPVRITSLAQALLLPLELAGVLVAAVSGSVAVARGARGRDFAATCASQLNATAPAMVASLGLLLAASALEVAILVG